MAMILRRELALASCTATSSAEQTKTMNVNIDDASVLSTARAVSACDARFPAQRRFNVV